jgi:hypothetical protein
MPTSVNVPMPDTVPPTPANHIGPQVIPVLTQAETADFQADVASLREAARRIESAASNIARVADTTTRKLTRKEKMAAAAVATGLVGIGVGSTLLVQRISRGRAAKHAAVLPVTE